MAQRVERALRRDPYVRDCKTPSLVPRLLRSLDTGIGRRVLKCYTSGEHKAMLDISVDPTLYTNCDLFRRDWLAVNVLSKYPKLQLGIDTAAAAVISFKESEASCLATNQRLRGRYATPTLGVSAESLIESARLKIARLLGDFDWDKVEPWFGFSSGASTKHRRDQGDAFYKMSEIPDVTRRAALLAVCAIWYSPLWRAWCQEQFGDDPFNWVTVVDGSSLTTVPKNAKTDRMIAIEPCMNMYLQRGFGGYIRERLKLVGIDLDDQTINQRLARAGSVSDFFATIDLKAASDSISIELVRRLLPPQWFEAMDTVRSERGTFASGEVVEFQKFSSMGNGFTFELESMCFWALAEAVCDQYEMGGVSVAVYGDDIIVPKAAAGWLMELLDYVGFKANLSKTFTAGPFRESCGKHYFNGVDVTPFYIRDEIKDVMRLYWYANSVRRWASNPTPGICDPRYYSAYYAAVELIPPKLRHHIPEGYGDGGLISCFDEATPAKELNRDPTRVGEWTSDKWVNGRWSPYHWGFSFQLRIEVVGRLVDVGARTPALLRCYNQMHRGGTIHPQDACVPKSLPLRADDVFEQNVGGSVDMAKLLVNRSKKRWKNITVSSSQWVEPGCWPM